MRLLLVLCLSACGTPPTTIIDARDDSGAGTDAGLEDAGASDAGTGDAGCEPPAIPAWTPVDTGGPDGEALSDCIARVGASTDDRLPLDQAYELTTFGGPGDEQPVACAGAADADGTWYYAANEQRFACGQRVRIVDSARARCVVVEVADLGPNACVEEAGARALWDVSPLAAMHLFGVSSVGYSEHRAVFGAPVASDNALGAVRRDARRSAHVPARLRRRALRLAGRLRLRGWHLPHRSDGLLRRHLLPRVRDLVP